MFYQETDQGLVLNVRAAPRSSRSGADGLVGDALKVRIHAAPVDGKANAELVEVLANAFDLPKRSVVLLAGSASKTKRVLLAAPDAAARTRLAAACAALPKS